LPPCSIKAGCIGAALIAERPCEFGAWLQARRRLIRTVASMHILQWRADLDNISTAG
jgi:hypothetical protein